MKQSKLYLQFSARLFLENWYRLLQTQTDVKVFLSHLLDEKKRKNPLYSQRAFAKQLGLSTTTLNEILTGKRHLTKKSIEKLKFALKHMDGFEETLQFAWKNLSRFAPEKSEFTEIAEWYYMAMLELCQTETFLEDPVWIGKRLGISPTQAQTVIDDLLRIGEFKRNRDGKLISTSLNTVGAANKDNIDNINRTTCDCLTEMQKAIMNHPPGKRFCATLLVPTSMEDYDYIQAKTVTFVQECMDYLGRDGVKKSEVFLLAVGFAPITKEV